MIEDHHSHDPHLAQTCRCHLSWHQYALWFGDAYAVRDISTMLFAHISILTSSARGGNSIFAISDPLSLTLPPGRRRVAPKVSRGCFWLPWTLARESHVWDAQLVGLAEQVVHPLPQSLSKSPHVLRDKCVHVH